jgi:peptidoglycan/LPS O-acetylase OafA/YrhL
VETALGSRTQQAFRVPWLDGVRAVASTYVVLHHAFLSVWPGYPDNHGPAYLGWLVPGQFGVVVFIVVSGYSLTLAPLSNAGRLPGGVGAFARRRIWRILPPYWAALIGSTLLVNLFAAPRDATFVDLKSFLVHAFLAQDLTANTTPNGAFWSIAVEAQIYVLFPLVLLMMRRRGALLMALAIALLTSMAHVLAIHGPSVFHKVENFTPQLFVAFAFGVAAAALTSRESRWLDRLCSPLLVGVVAALAVGGMWLSGPRMVMTHVYWSDLVVGLVTAMAFLALGRGATTFGTLLASRPLAGLGRFSYSTYLVHAPVLLVVAVLLVRPLGWSPVPSFMLLVGTGLLLALGMAYGFFLVFEKPFLTVRSFRALAEYVRSQRRVRAPTAVATPPAADPGPAS